VSRSKLAVLCAFGWVLGPLFGEGQRGLDLITRAIRLNPNYPDWYENGRVMAAYYARDFEQTLAAFQRVPSQTVETRLYAALSYAQIGDKDGAAKQLEELLKLDPKFTARQWLGVQPHHEEARKVFIDGARKAGLPE
jgi:tetratricopeptide (TPR) repeat protein